MERLKEYLRDLLFHIKEIYSANILVNKNILDSILNTINRDEIYKEIKALNAQREKLLDLYLDGLIEKHVYTQRENKINARIEQDVEKGYFKMTLPNKLSEEEILKSQIIFDTMMCGISELLQEYSDFINLEVIENV